MALDIPIIPGLTPSTEGLEPLSLTELLDQLDGDTVYQIVGMLTGVDEGAEEETVEEELAEDPAEEADETMEDEAAESTEEQAAEVAAGTEDFDALASQIEGAVEEGEGYVTEIEELLKTAKDSKDAGGEPKPIEKLLKDAKAMQEDLVVHREAFDEAVADEDPNTAATHGMKVQECAQHLMGMVEQARAYAAVSEAEEKPSEENPAPALAVWAQRQLGR